MHFLVLASNCRVSFSSALDDICKAWGPDYLHASLCIFIIMWGFILNIFTDSCSFFWLVLPHSLFLKEMKQLLPEREELGSVPCVKMCDHPPWPCYLQGWAHPVLPQASIFSACFMLLRVFAHCKRGPRGAHTSFNTSYRSMQDATLCSRLKDMLCDSFFIPPFLSAHFFLFLKTFL